MLTRKALRQACKGILDGKGIPLVLLNKTEEKANTYYAACYYHESTGIYDKVTLNRRTLRNEKLLITDSLIHEVAHVLTIAEHGLQQLRTREQVACLTVKRVGELSGVKLDYNEGYLTQHLIPKKYWSGRLDDGLALRPSARVLKIANETAKKICNIAEL